MAQTKADVLKKAAEIETLLKGKGLFLEGSKPTATDVKLFNELLGNGNVALYRWVKHMASFSEAERNAWTAPVKTAVKATAAPPKADAPKAAPKAEPKAAPAPKVAAPAPAKDEDEIDLFGEETEEEHEAALKRKAAEAEKKKSKPAVIAKSSILVDIKPWDDETNMTELAEKLILVQRDGLLWGAQKLVPVVANIKKLQQLLVIEDDKISGDDLEDIILEEFKDYVQSMDIVAWNKV